MRVTRLRVFKERHAVTATRHEKRLQLHRRECGLAAERQLVEIAPMLV